jgi:hypothetical protein
MITSRDCTERYGDPKKESSMILWDVPAELEVGVIPKKIYINKDFQPVLEQAFRNLVTGGHAQKLKTYDGCFNIRANKGNSASYSLHAWGLAIDFDAAWNRFNSEPTMNLNIVKCFEDAGCEWGGRWSVQDGMHFQLKAFPTAQLTHDDIEKLSCGHDWLIDRKLYKFESIARTGGTMWATLVDTTTGAVFNLKMIETK